MQILVAGGAGFVGSWLCERLISEGHVVWCVDNLLTGSKNNIAHLLGRENFQFFRQDVTLPLDFTKIDAIYHLASPASPNANSPKSYMQFPVETMLVNSLGTYNLLEIAKQNKARFLYASSSEVYGEPGVHPQKEEYWGNVNPNGPRSCYDEGKRFGEAMVFSYVRKFQIDARVIRIFNTYGPKMDPRDGRVISNFIVASLKNQPLEIYGTGEQTRSFCYISDLVDGLISAMNSSHTSGEVFNLGNDGEFSIIEVANILEKINNKKLKRLLKPLPQDDPTRRKPDLSKAKKVFKYEPKVYLEEALRKTIEYFKSLNI